ncbi:velvet factor-domain-containing protein [Melampsora americana]|nr:velvet factor-domain-containing protein [Melampsora americana]
MILSLISPPSTAVTLSSPDPDCAHRTYPSSPTMSHSRSFESDSATHSQTQDVSSHSSDPSSSSASSSKLFTFSEGQFAHRPLIFRAEVVQQPERCRMSGFGEKDRRPIDPPPVVKLDVVDSRGGIVAPETIDADTLFCHVSLHSADRREPRGLVYHPSSSMVDQLSSPVPNVSDSELESYPVRNLLGSLTTQARLLRNEFGQLGVYFIFSDLAVRTEGSWTCRFSIVDLNSPDDSLDGDMPELVSTFSGPFHVSPAKTFRGMLDSTPLTKAFSNQGVKLILRNVGCPNSDEAQSS